MLKRKGGYEEEVAIKSILSTRLQADYSLIKSFRDEIVLTASLNHINVIACKGACWEQGAEKLALVLDFAERGSLKQVLGDQSLTWADPLLGIGKGIASGLRYLHFGQDKRE